MSLMPAGQLLPAPFYIAPCTPCSFRIVIDYCVNANTVQEVLCMHDRAPLWGTQHKPQRAQLRDPRVCLCRHAVCRPRLPLAAPSESCSAPYGRKEILFAADTLYAAFWEALDGLGLGWSFAEGAADRHSWTGLVMRLLAVGISIGGTLITALLLGLTSGEPAPLQT